MTWWQASNRILPVTNIKYSDGTTPSRSSDIGVAINTYTITNQKNDQSGKRTQLENQNIKDCQLQWQKNQQQKNDILPQWRKRRRLRQTFEPPTLLLTSTIKAKTHLKHSIYFNLALNMFIWLCVCITLATSHTSNAIQKPNLGSGQRLVSTLAFPRRRSSFDGSSLSIQMQSRAVDTSAQFEVLEGQPRGTVVGFIPIKTGFTYRFNEPPREFVLDASTGEIKTNVVLDREDMHDRYDLVVLSSQPTYPIEVRITVLDINDNAPEFPEPSIAVSFSESAAPGTRLLLDAATDRDSAQNGVTDDYRIIDGNIDGKFRLAVTTNPSGAVSYLHLETTGNLDRETQGFYQLNVSARDGGSPPRYGYLQVNVTIVDVNDNPPIFDHSDYIVSLNESVTPGTSVLRVMASDNDLGDNAKITYYLASTERQFTVDPETGVVSTMAHLKCPQQNCQSTTRPGTNCPKSCVFTVFARDHGIPRQDGRTYVTVNLLDTNDHDPVILFKYFPATGTYATVDENAENGTAVAAVAADDKDDGLNGETTIRIVSGNELGHFYLEKRSLFHIVRVNAVLDREEISKYNLTIIAMDKGSPPRTSTAHLIIHVNDVNDHEPVFEKSEYSAVLTELAPPGSYVASITATDEDSGVNAQIFYDFVSGNNNQWFKIDTASGLITTQASLDREIEGSVELSISAHDGGPNPKWAYTTLKVTILDENDEAPKFLQQHFNVSLSENAAPQTLVAMLTASDHDQGTNGSVTYSLPDFVERKYPEQFTLDALTGQLTTRTSLDRETIAHYEIYVVARDQGSPPQSATATVYLTVEDVNDNSPEFYPRDYFYVLPDGGGDGIANHQQKPLWKVSASDRDTGDNALITYKLESGGDGLFVIDSSSGVITFRVGDIRQHSWPKTFYKLIVSAKDHGGRPSEQDATVEIVVQSKMETLDFELFRYEFKMIEDHGQQPVTLGREVGRVQVKQLASHRSKLPTTSGLSNGVEYSIVYGDNAENFIIDRRSGRITTAQRIDRETKSQYQLTVVARSGTVSYGKCIVNIIIGDLNDNAPIFAQDRDDEILLNENAAVGQEVYLSRAQDKDIGNNSQITYTITYNPEGQFEINATSGVLYLKRPIRADPGTRFRVELTATDAGQPTPLSSKHTITILIADVNDHTPVFDHTSYETSLLESAKVNTRFFPLGASDVDLGANGRISYEILEGNADQKFGVFPDGYLFVRSVLDREERDYYALTVACRDSGIPQRYSIVPVIIHLIDENDNPPRFTNSTFTFSIAENEPIDSFVGKLTATDLDIGRNAELIYSLATQAQDFMIDSRNGFIKTLHSFDREELVQRRQGLDGIGGENGASTSKMGASSSSNGQNYIQLEAIVSDNGVHRLHDKVNVKIIITDVNDNAPQFLRAPYRVQISEGAGVGTHIMRVYTTDADEGLNGDVYYSLAAGNEDGRFVIDDATGQLSLARQLDREQQSIFKLTVVARDAAIKGQLSSNTTITIDVLDENDVAPEFAQTNNMVSVLEKSPVGTELMRFRATDSDLGVNSQVSFSITAGNRKDTFHIDPISGSLYLHKALDYEDITKYKLNITASDGGTPRLSATIIFTVNVVDENDNPPSFPNTAIVRQIKEGIPLKTPIVTVTAEDPDSDVNGKITYSIRQQEPELPGGLHFGINSITGIIHTLREIDREMIDTFRLTIAATDQAQYPEPQLSAEKLVTVIVEDINDNTPIFVSMNAAILPMSFKESSSSGSELFGQNQDGAIVMFVQATDADSSSNGLVTYEMVSGNTNLFKLHRTTGALTLTHSISQPEVRYQLALKATDEAVQSERKSADAYITIIATNDAANGPIFQQHEQNGSVYENEPTGTSILTVSARLNSAEIEYYVTNITAVGGKFNGGNKNERNQVERLFDIDTKLGILSTAKELDREAGPDTYEIEVYAIALGGAPRTTSTKVRVTILDKNDSPPVFRDTPLVYNISEDFGAGHNVTTIHATDPDTLSTLTFSLVNGDDGKFVLETDTGKLQLKDSLDRETKDVYKLRIRVSDGIQHTETIATIQVTDTNDNPPVFEVPVYSFDIPENAPRGYQVGIITATDADLGTNAAVSYSVISDWANDVFSLNPQTGVLTLTARLDYEEVQHYILVIQAQDNGHPSLSTTITVYCNVLDLNDNAPIFDPMSYSKEIYENVSIGTDVVMVTATDIDSGDNGRIEYTITAGDDNNDFEITVNGTIRTQRELDRETKSSYNLIVTARDCAKEFPTLYDGEQNQAQHHLQRRHRQNRQQLYVEQLQKQQHQQPQQQQRLSSSVQVTIILKDVNDEAPQFTTSNETSVLENIAENTVIMVVKAIDHDEGRSGYIEYALDDEDGHVPFTLGPIDGLLRVSGRLDRELRSSYLLNVTAKDRGDPPQSEHSNILVKILDENDNSPVFDPKQYSASIAENASIGAMVLQVSATDIDEGANGRVRFTIAAGDNNRDFSISEDSGVVRVAKNLNYERKSRYVLTVRAEDCAGDVVQSNSAFVTGTTSSKVSRGNNPLIPNPLPRISPAILYPIEPRYDTAELTIIITDINDNPPTFLDSPYVAYVMENTIPPNGGFMLTVQAYDADSPPFNSQVRYFLKEGDADLFRINASTGDISLLRALDREVKGEYSLTLVAMDTGSPPLMGTGTVRVIVQDVNDHSPEFSQQSYKANIQENLSIGTKVLQPVATDKDYGLNAKIRFSILGEKSGRFKIDENTGEITTAAILDREETPSYNLMLRAEDCSTIEPRFSVVNLTVIVTDVNDNSPNFEASSFNVHIPNRIGIGEFVFGAKAFDLDAENNALLAYNISGKDADKFVIDTLSGVIKTKQVLNKKGSSVNFDSVFSLTIHAIDHGIEPRSTVAELTILLHPEALFPSFSYMANTQFMLPEDVLEGKVITKVLATSPKKGAAGNIRFSIGGGNINEAIRIDPGTGVVSIGKNGLDYETAHHYEIWIEAADSDKPVLRSVMLLTINVTDANDNEPIMEQTIYSTEILEEEPPPQSIVKVKAFDRDSGDNGEITYRLANDFERTFEINADTGEIFTTMRLDREKVSSYKIIVEAVDQGMPQLTGTASVMLTLLDKNDNPSLFTRLISANVTENAEIGSLVLRVTTSDADEGVNAMAVYSLEDNTGDKFKIDPISGNVTVAGTLDREQQEEYILRVVAYDGAWNTQTPLTITIQDQNDNAPEFEHSFYSFNLPELQRNIAFVGQVIATDRDKQGPNSVISYALQQPSSLFTIDPATGELFSKRTIKFKHSQFISSPENTYSLTVVATDNGKPPLSSECLVNINIVDANNNPPKFEQKSYLAPVLEQTKVGERVIKVHAVDEWDYGLNAQIDYIIVGGNATLYFAIDKIDGWLIVTKMLNLPPGTFFVAKVKAIDRGVPPQADETHVNIVITGENRFTPEFTALSYQVNVPENEPVGATILTDTASDRDDGPNGMLRYKISGGNERHEFAVNENGAVTVLQSLDYETIQEYHLNITVTDLGFKPKSAVAMLTVILIDINDNPPIFNQTEYHASIAENKPPNTFVFQAHATDRDSPKNAVIRYSIVSGTGRNFFKINDTSGLITSTVSFDYEEKRDFNLQIMAANPDSNMQTTTLLTVHITGVNEFYPQFVQPVFHFDVSESSAIGTAVGSIQATDKDDGEDGKVYYLLVGSSNDKGFSINTLTGVISISRHLDRETQNRVVLTVLAKNYGGIRGNDTDEAQVLISIQDGNDPPEFLKKLYTTRISEAAPIGTKVVNVKAIDKDVRPQNNQFSYSIISGNIKQSLKIDSQSGEITTARLLDREKDPVYILLVGAIDTGLPPQTGTTTVRIELEDVNDNWPTFDRSGLIGYISENEPPGTSIMTLEAKDADLPPNGAPFSYYLADNKHKNFISIEKTTGVVRSTKTFDREETKMLEAIIEVEDSGTPKQRARHLLTIEILDQNDNPSTPRIVHVLVNVFNHDIPIGKIADVHPNDADTTGNYKCRFVQQSQTLKGFDVFTLPNACDLHTTRQTTFNSYSYAVSGNDGKHEDVVSSVTISFQNFDNNTIANSVTLLIHNMTAEDLLSSHYHNLLEVLKSSQESNDEVLIYSIRNIMENVTNVEILVSVRTLQQSYRTPRYVTERLNKKRDALTRLLKNDRVEIGFNPCAKGANACNNGGVCSAEIYVHNSQSNLNIIESEALIFSGPQISHDYICKCVDGFTGVQCDKRQDSCVPNPCHNNAQCRRIANDFQCVCPPNREGKQCQQEREDVCSSNPCRNGGSCRRSPDGSSFFCLCRPGHRGNECENIADSCRPNPCLYGGLCVSLKPGYKCNCPDGRYGRNCEKSTYSFQDLSFMTFPALDAVTNDISIVFATTKPDGLLLYNYGIQTGGRSDFLAIEVVKGKAFFSFGGARTAITTVVVEANSRGNLADGKWHKITATRNGRVMSLSVSSCTENGDVCEECRPGDAKCYADDVGPIGTLNFNKQPLLIGGLITADPILERPGQIHTDDLVGCVHSVTINGRLLNMSNPLKQRGIQETCNRDVNGGGPCQRGLPTDPELSLCGDYGTCMDRWHSAVCQCGSNLLSPDCYSSLEPITLSEGGFVEFQISEKHRRMQLLDNLYNGNNVWSYDLIRRRRYTIDNDNITALAQVLDPPKSLSLVFRTYKENGLLLYAATNKTYTIVELRVGKLSYYSKHAVVVNVTMNTIDRLNDGKWHNVTLHATNRIFNIMIDNMKVGEELEFSGIHDFLDPYLSVLSVGGIKREHLVHEFSPSSFEGCIANFTINNEIQPFNGSGSVFNEVRTRGKVLWGCAEDIVIGSAQVSDPLSISITLVIVFFVVLIVAITGSYVIYRFRGKQEKIGSLSCGVPGFKIKHGNTAMLSGGAVSQNQADHVLTRNLHANDSIGVGYHGDNGDLIRGVAGHHLVGPELLSRKFKEREIGPGGEHQKQRPQRPDIIEREVVSKSPHPHEEHHPPLLSSNQTHHPHDHTSSVDMGSEYPEHYDLENASSIAPSDIDVVYHYKGYREAGGMRKYKATPPPVASYNPHHKHQSSATAQQQHRHSPRHAMGVGSSCFVSRVPPQTSQSSTSSTPRQHQSTPLARLSPSSEMSSQHPRILTLHDISGKPLQSALLATASSSGGVGKDPLHSNSERSLNSPVMSQLSGQSSSASRVQKTGVPPQSPGQTPMGLTAEEIERLNTRPRTSSLVSTLDAVSSSSEVRRVPGGGGHHLSMSADVDAHSSTSTDESGNDSFTCSEIEYDNNSLNGDAKFPNNKSLSEKRSSGVGRSARSVDGVSSNIAKAPPLPSPSYDGFDSSFRGSLSTLVASDDDLSTHLGGIYRQKNGSTSPSTITLGWDYVLNWGPNFESLMGVFKDIAELPDTLNEQQQQHQQHIAPTLRLPGNVQKPSEEYV